MFNNEIKMVILSTILHVSVAFILPVLCYSQSIQMSLENLQETMMNKTWNLSEARNLSNSKYKSSKGERIMVVFSKENNGKIATSHNLDQDLIANFKWKISLSSYGEPILTVYELRSTVNFLPASYVEESFSQSFLRKPPNIPGVYSVRIVNDELYDKKKKLRITDESNNQRRGPGATHFYFQ